MVGGERTNPTRRLNPPLPVDEHGNWYKGDDEEEEEEEEEEEQDLQEGGGSSTATAAAADDDGLTDAERAILADIDQL